MSQGPGAPVHALGALEMAAALHAGQLSSMQVVLELVARIEDQEPSVNALIALAPDVVDQARAADARRAAGVARSPLDGVPVLLKDNIECRGLPGSAGSLALAGSPAHRDAELVTRLRHAGLVVLGSANLSEWANFRGLHSTSGWSAVGGVTDNPWLSGASPGGSSSGCGAALAAGYAPLAVGTETDGSIVCPASLCGVVGLKPTVGAVPTTAVVPLANSQDSPGPMARSVADTAALLAVLAGGAIPGPSAAGVATVRVGFVPAWLSGDLQADDLVAAAVERLAARGLPVRELSVPAPGPDVEVDEVAVLAHEMGDDLTHYLATRPGPGPRSVAEVVAFNEANAGTELAHFGQEFLELAAASGGRRGPGYAQARRRNLDWAVGRVLAPALGAGRGQVDVLASLAYGPAWRTDLREGDVITTGVSTHASAIAGWPLLSVPLGLVGGLPVGLVLAGAPGNESMLLEVAAIVEADSGWGARLAPDR